jgi:predicted site-specific integrase-resolvase
MSNETPIYDLKDLSKKLKISIRTLREYVKRGELKARKIGKAYYVTETNLMVFLGSDS